MKLKHFLNLEWKKFFRSASFGKSIAINILMIFLALYFIGIFLLLGIALYPGLKKAFPEQDPFVIVNGLLFFYILADIVMRFFFQKLPVMSVKPLLPLPIKRSKVVNYVLRKSAFSFFNFLPLFAFVPFSIALLLNGYPTASVLIWLLAIIVGTLIVNFLNFIIESFASETELSFLPVIVFAGGLFALNYFDAISFTDLVSNGFMGIYNNPIFILIPILVLVGLYIVNFKQLKNKLYLDSSLKTKVTEVNASNMEWTKRFGDIAPFMQLDLKLLWRNKRSKSSIWLLLIGLLYGLFFYPNPVYADMPWFFAFVGIFVTGIFLMNFGQFIPAWDSGYYKLLMSQNIKYEQYLKSKFTLMALSVIILFVLSIPYVYFGWKILLAHFAAAIYNIGVNTHVIMYGGSFNRKKIDLNQRAAFNYQGTGAVQWLIGIPLMLLPLAIFGITYAIASFEIGCVVLTLLGIIGIVLHQKLMKFITQKYVDSKYKMIDAFSQD
ncbi:hypothetical protein SAMN04515667_0573 [Formosa sp. Hel1_31_208]|uniref:DUF5687 family protein n=1 Tax=Formosa sp. Hel1_31_208 TaxID=1798225 RepID=UPI0008793BE5|nr:DUF5687 family protein [Formosa sp. Hel1_31_208]SDR75991.1 hypothetical protein SAMN04515667_0573 [Formosa sp. Hel1_31_208]